MKEAIILAYVNAEGVVVDVKNVDGTPIEYDAEEKELKKSIVGAQLRSGYSPDCCWRLVGGVWKCRRRYCT